MYFFKYQFYFFEFHRIVFISQCQCPKLSFYPQTVPSPIPLLSNTIPESFISLIIPARRRHLPADKSTKIK